MDPSTTGTAAALAVVLILSNAFFVAAEFVLVAVRRGRLERAVQESSDADRRLPDLLDRADELALVSQAGSTLCTLLLGTVAVLWALGSGGIDLLPGIGDGWRVFIALAVIVLIHLVVGTHLPKVIAIQRSEWLARRLTLRPLRLMALLLRPITWPILRAVRAFSALVGLPAAGFQRLVHTPEEIRLLVAEGHEQGVVEADEREMVYGVFEFSDTVAREVMTPRTEVVGVPVDIGIDDLIEVIRTGGHSRLPVYDTSIDSIVGVLLVKDLLPHLHRRDPDRPFQVTEVMRDPYFVPDTKPVDDLLAEFRHQSMHLAIVLDEFGGTYGLVTMEDLLEEIVGEIQDEYDVAEHPEFADTTEGDVLINGGASISEVNDRFDLDLPEADFDTIGGFIFGALGRVPQVGDTVVAPRGGGESELRVEEMDDRRVLRVRLSAPSTVPVDAPASSAAEGSSDEEDGDSTR